MDVEKRRRGDRRKNGKTGVTKLFDIKKKEGGKWIGVTIRKTD
jgi:hypothetical protein